MFDMTKAWKMLKTVVTYVPALLATFNVLPLPSGYEARHRFSRDLLQYRHVMA